MNDLVLLCLLFFIIIRIIGLGVSIDFFYDTKDVKFLYFSIGWFFWIIAAIFPIISGSNITSYIYELFLVLNSLFASLGGIFLMWGLNKYFLSVPSRLMQFLIFFSIIIPIILFYTISYEISIKFSSLIQNFILSFAYIIIPLKRKNLKRYIGKSIRWFFATLALFFFFIPVTILIVISGESYGLYNSNNIFLIILNYLPTMSSTILLIILLVHLEYNISSNQKFELKDTYSHNLGNILQVINSSSDLIKISANLNKQEEDNLKLIQNKCKEASKLIKNIRKL